MEGGRDRRRRGPARAARPRLAGSAGRGQARPIAGDVRKRRQAARCRAPALPRPAPTPGSYNCRLIKLGKATAKGKPYESFKPFFCYVEVEGDLLTIVKQTGSQRPAGRLWEDDDPNRLIFLGSLALGDEEQPLAYGDDPKRDMAGVLERIAPFRWRLVIPWPQSTSKLDVFELTPVDFANSRRDERSRVARRPGGGARDPGRLRAGRARRSAIPKCSALLGHHFTRPKMRALCKVLAYVDDEAEERGEPELAVLVVRQSDGLPGQGWWVGGAKKHGYTGLWEGPEGGEADPQAAAAGVRVLGGTRAPSIR